MPLPLDWWHECLSWGLLWWSSIHRQGSVGGAWAVESLMMCPITPHVWHLYVEWSTGLWFLGQQLLCWLSPFPMFPVISPLPPVACFWVSFATCSWSSHICHICPVLIWVVVCCAPLPCFVTPGPVCCLADLFFWLHQLGFDFGGSVTSAALPSSSSEGEQVSLSESSGSAQAVWAYQCHFSLLA